jgi:hypothetical protein
VIEIEICIDWVQPFNSTPYSLGVVAMRARLPPEFINKPFNAQIVALIPGPKQPAQVQSYLAPLLDDLDAACKGVSVAGITGKIVVLVSAVVGDRPARDKVSLAVGAAGALGGCGGFCVMEGKSDKADPTTGARSGVHFYGYSAAVPQSARQTLLHDNGVAPDTPMLVGDGRLKVSNDEHFRRALRVHDKRVALSPAAVIKKAVFEEEGVHGMSLLLMRPNLKMYVEALDIYVVGAVHALLFGLFKDFIEQILPKKKPNNDAPRPDLRVPNHRRALIAARASRLSLPSDYSRNYRDIIKHINTFKMEDCLHFIDVAGPLVLKASRRSEVDGRSGNNADAKVFSGAHGVVGQPAATPHPHPHPPAHTRTRIIKCTP